MIEDKQGIAKKNVHTSFYIGPNHMGFFLCLGDFCVKQILNDKFWCQVKFSEHELYS